MKFVERIFDGLINNSLNTVGALLILIIALPLIRDALRDKAPPPAPPEPSPIQIESPWFLQTVTRLQFDVENIKEQLGVMSSKIDGIAKLLRKRQRSKS